MQTIYTKEFKKDYKKFPSYIKEKVDSRLRLFATSEFDTILNNHKLHYPWDGHRSINITGDIRLIYKQIELVRLLVRVGSHSELYD